MPSMAQVTLPSSSKACKMALQVTELAGAGTDRMLPNAAA